jgi:hypothetical protein
MDDGVIISVQAESGYLLITAARFASQQATTSAADSACRHRLLATCRCS